MREPCYVLDNQYLLLHNEYRPANVVWEGTTFVDIEDSESMELDLLFWLFHKYFV